jgi:proteasome lid subunit RPN8/RPN11
VSGADPLSIRISRWRWRRLIAELARRGRGERESGAFLLARPAGRRVAGFVFFDDLDPDALTGAISIRGEAFGRLWAICAERGMRVIADVHTHPGSGVAQSHVDAANPMIAKCGHLGIIVPQFAQHSRDPRDAGVHVYRGDHRWTSAFGDDAVTLVRRTWW